jgi:hypothetical protein
LQGWLQGREDSLPENVCPVLDVFDFAPRAAAEWFAMLREDELPEVARRVQWTLQHYDQRTGARLSGGLGSTLGWMLDRALSGKDLPRAFRAGLAAVELWQAMRESGQTGWNAFESRLQDSLQAPRSRAPAQATDARNSAQRVSNEEKDAWSDWGDFDDYLVESAGNAADRHGLSDHEWGEIQRAFESGVIKSKDPGLWERRFGRDPIVRTLIEQDYRTSFKTPLASPTP